MDEPPPPPPPAPGVRGARERCSLVWAACVGSLALAAVFPLVNSIRAWLVPAKAFRAAPSWPDAWLEAAPAVAVATVVAAWVFVFWAMIGSFLNVVVHRLPAGQSVVTGGSRCPRCHEPIRWHDNLPIVGWLRLGGHCRACAAPISIRYPLVEAACAGICSAVCFREVLSGGANIPLRDPHMGQGLDWALRDPDGSLIGLAALHCAAICVLMVWGLVTRDGRRVPAPAILATLAAALVGATFLPGAHPLPCGLGLGAGAGSAAGAAARLASGFCAAGVGGLAGLVAGLVVEACLNRIPRGDAAGRTGMPFPPPSRLHDGLALVGIVCGWQGMLGTLVVLLVLCLIHLVVWASSRWPTLPLELLLVPAAFIHICAWRQLVEGLGGWWAGPDPTPGGVTLPLALALALMLLLMGAIFAVTPAAPTPSPPSSAPSGPPPSPPSFFPPPSS